MCDKLSSAASKGWVGGGREEGDMLGTLPSSHPPKSRKCQVLFQEELTRTHEQEERRVGWMGGEM